jgi:hypothetical protein
MGWARGADVMHGIIEAAHDLPMGALMRNALYLKVIPLLEDEDWDTQDECLGRDDMFDAAMEHLHPEWDWSLRDE